VRRPALAVDGRRPLRKVGPSNGREIEDEGMAGSLFAITRE
jgi:hypothetical protein